MAIDFRDALSKLPVKQIAATAPAWALPAAMVRSAADRNKPPISQVLGTAVNAGVAGAIDATVPGAGTIRAWMRAAERKDDVDTAGKAAAAAADAGAPTAPWGDVFTDALEPPGGPATSTAAPQVDPFAELDGIRADLEGAANQIDADYASRLEELRGMYRLAETPEERAQLQFILGNIEAQREAGHETIRKVYDDAVATAGVHADKIRSTGEDRAGRIGDVYRDSATDIQGTIDSAGQMYAGSGLGVGAQPVTGGAGDWLAMVQAAAPREQALAEQLGGIAADQQDFLGGLMAAEGGAAQGQLAREAAAMAAQATYGHQQSVSDRINAERMALAQSQMALGNRYEQRGWDLEDTARQIALDLAEQRRVEGQAEASSIPTDPQERHLFALALLNKYGPWALPEIQEIIPEFDPDTTMLPGAIPGVDAPIAPQAGGGGDSSIPWWVSPGGAVLSHIVGGR